MEQKVSSDLVGQRKLRLEKVAKMKHLGIDPYPSKSARNTKTADVINDFAEFDGQEVILAGRLMSWREHGALIFGHIQDQSGKIQIYIKQNELASTDIAKQNLGFEDLNLVDIGDIIEVQGNITKTQTGEISIMPKYLKILTKTIRPLPTSLEDKEDRFRRRYLDMILHPEVRQRFERRAKFWQATREFLNKNGFVEVNIPVLEHTTGGADAKPFVTYYDSLNQNFYLRISHELPLKRLLGGGFEKVYDIGARFRNEGFSDEHLPEHIAMEWYWAYADYRDGMNFTQELFRYVMQEVYGTLQFKIRGFDVDLSKEWEEIWFADIIKERFDIDIFNDSLEKMNSVLKDQGVDLGEETNKNRVIDNLWKVIRKTIGGPAFLLGVPKFMSPLSKANVQNPNLVDRFQPLIAGSELANAWSELNDPVDQLDRFVDQQQMRNSGDEEAQMLDLDFVEMLEYGMPPAVGYGHSERVFWFFENVTAKEGVPFPQLKSEIDNVTKLIYKDVLESIYHSSDNDFEQDFSKKIVIVINQDLENWRKANSISHVAAYIGNKLKGMFATGENFITQDGKEHPRNTQYPIIILTAKPGQMTNFMRSVRESGLLYHGFIKEMIDTTDDKEIIELLKTKTDEEIEYLAIGLFGDNTEVDRLTKKYSLYK